MQPIIIPKSKGKSFALLLKIFERFFLAFKTLCLKQFFLKNLQFWVAVLITEFYLFLACSASKHGGGIDAEAMG